VYWNQHLYNTGFIKGKIIWPRRNGSVSIVTVFAKAKPVKENMNGIVLKTLIDRHQMPNNRDE
jgi:hypothetical protein